MSLKDLNKLYKDTVGRNVDAGGYDYWKPLLESGQTTLSEIENLLVASDEYKDRAKAVKEHQDSGKGNPSEATLDALGSAYKGELMSDSVAKDVAITPASTAKAPAKKAPAKKAPAVKPWQQNYDATTSNFEDLNDIKAAESSDPRKVSLENNMTGMLEQKGLLADQAQPYIDSAYAQDTTLDALKHIAQQTGTAEDRGDVWGASGIDKGKSYIDRFNLAEDDPNFLNVEASTDWQTNAELISKLYTEGFGREPDIEGLKGWTEQLTKNAQDPTKGMSYKDIAASFAASKEATIRTDYHDTFGRDIDDAGLQYWLPDKNAYSKGQLTGSLEQDLRNTYGAELGQFSNEADRQANMAAGGIWTDVQEGGYANLDWRDYTTTSGQTNVQSEFGDLKYDFGHRKDTPWHNDFRVATGSTQADASSGEQKTGLAKFQEDILKGETTLEDVKNILERRGDVMTVGAFYDVDDTEGGSGIGRTLTLDEIQPYMSESKDLNEFAANLGEEKWALLTKELYKQPHPELGWGEVTYPKGRGAAGVIANPGVMAGIDERGTNRNTLSHDYQVPVPPDYEGPDLANVTKENIEYMPPKDGTVPNRPLRNLDSSYTPAPQQAVRNQGAFVAGTSAKGVRRRQSSAARSGRSAMGTKQLARNNMQIKSLNI